MVRGHLACMKTGEKPNAKVGDDILSSATDVVNFLECEHLVKQTGRTKGTRYYVEPKLILGVDFAVPTTLTRIAPHRLRALIQEDLRRHPNSAFGDIHQRIGEEIPLSQLRRELKTLVSDGLVNCEGEKRWRRYWVRNEIE